MKLKVADFDIDVFKQTKPSRWLRWRGWYWQECHLPPYGPFGSMGHALRHFTDEIVSGKLMAAMKAKELSGRGASRPKK